MYCNKLTCIFTSSTTEQTIPSFFKGLVCLRTGYCLQSSSSMDVCFSCKAKPQQCTNCFINWHLHLHKLTRVIISPPHLVIVHRYCTCSFYYLYSKCIIHESLTFVCNISAASNLQIEQSLIEIV